MYSIWYVVFFNFFSNSMGTKCQNVKILFWKSWCTIFVYKILSIQFFFDVQLFKTKNDYNIMKLVTVGPWKNMKNLNILLTIFLVVHFQSLLYNDFKKQMWHCENENKTWHWWWFWKFSIRSKMWKCENTLVRNL